MLLVVVYNQLLTVFRSMKGDLNLVLVMEGLVQEIARVTGWGMGNFEIETINLRGSKYVFQTSKNTLLQRALFTRSRFRYYPEEYEGYSWER
jgi:hypothetical protein